MFRNKTKTAPRPQHRTLQIESLETRNMMSASPVAIPFIEQNPTALIADPLAAPASTVAPALVPSQIKAAYGFSSSSSQNGAGQTIAIVVADNVFYRYGYKSDGTTDFSKPLPSLQDDLNTFDTKYNLPSLNLGQPTTQDNNPVYIPGSYDATRNHWEIEAALDVEWAHAIAPGAKIVLFEAASGSMDDLAKSAQEAAALPGVSVVSMSWSTAEFANETSYDHYFTTPAGHAPVTFVTGSGDTGYRSYDANGNQTGIGGAQYPAASYNVLSVGGTTLTQNSNGSFSETGWSWDSFAGDTKLWASGGGISQYENQPTYQKPFFPSTKRTTPDVAYNGDINTPYSIYFSDAYNPKTKTEGPAWTTGSGTSEGAPQWAAIIAIANQGRVSHNLPVLHSAISDVYALSSNDFKDITTGNNGYLALAGYDLVTGRGTPKANLIVADLTAFKEPALISLPPININPIGTVPNAGNTGVAGGTGMAMPSTIVMSNFSTTDANPIGQRDFVPSSLLQHSNTPSLPLLSVPQATQPIDFGALLANTHNNDQVDHLIDSLFDFSDHTPAHHNFNTNLNRR